MAKEKKTQSAAQAVEMSLEEAKAFRASLHKPVKKVLSDEQKREAFRIWWAGHKKTYTTSRQIEKAIWLHLCSIGMNNPEDFEDGLFNFGYKKS